MPWRLIRSELAINGVIGERMENWPSGRGRLFSVSIDDNGRATPVPVLIPSKFSDPTKRDTVKDFLKWMMTDGQQYCEPLAYAKLPKEVVVKELKAIAKIQ